MDKTVLVVDDKAAFRRLAEATLASTGLRVLTASDGGEALVAIAIHRPDLVLLDLRMPGIDGIQTLQRIRHHPELRHTPVIVLSAASDKRGIIEASSLGISGYLLKSGLSNSSLIGRVGEALGLGPHSRGRGQAPGRRAQAGRSGSHLGVQPSERRPPHMGERSHEEATQGPSPGVSASAPALEDELSACTLPPIPSTTPAGASGSLPKDTRSQLKERVVAGAQLSSFSPIVNDVMTLTASDDCSMESISGLVGRDPIMTAKVLSLANSAAYARGTRVDSVGQAVRRVGIQGLRNIIVNLAVVERFTSTLVGDQLTLNGFWEHALACGLIASDLAHSICGREPESAFTAGLLHDLGRLIFIETLGDQYRAVLDDSRARSVPLEQSERDMLGVTHAEIMDSVLTSWRFPRQLIDPIRLHHTPMAAVLREARPRAIDVLLLTLADHLAHALLIGDSGNPTIYATNELCRVLNVPEACIRSLESGLRQRVDGAKSGLLGTGAVHGAEGPTGALLGSLPHPFRPYFLGSAPAFDAYRILCDRLSDGAATSDAAPNLAVVHIATAKDRDELLTRLHEVEFDAHMSGLPTLILTPLDPKSFGDTALGSRPLEVIGTPTPLSMFEKAVGRLLSGQQSRTAA